MSKKPTVLMILDGYGLNDKCEANAVCEGKTPVMDQLMSQCPFVKGNASGMAVGLPEGQMGNSEVGHLNMGAGRIVYQELTRITKEIQDGDFFKNEALLAAVKNAKENNSALHLWDCYQTVVYTATSLIFLVCWNWQKEKVWKKYMYTASWMVVTLRRHPVKDISKNCRLR
jgi:bisphosphoglycerate-independent phosphoglycerate mutase (AlkP superfamily)